MADLHPNAAWSTIANAPGVAGLSVAVTPGTGARFAANANATLRAAGTILPLEIVRVTAVVGDTLTITRLAETDHGASAASLDAAVGWEIFQGPTAKTFTDIEAVMATPQAVPASFAIAGPSPWHDVTHPTYGAVGNGVADDTAAIQAAINAAGVGTVFLPPGTYKTTASLVATVGVRIIGSGIGGSTRNCYVTGNFADYLIRYDMGGNWTGPTVEGIWMRNTHASGGCIYTNGVNCPARYSDLYLQAWRCMTLDSVYDGPGGGNFTTLVQNVKMVSNQGWPTAPLADGWGLYCFSHTNCFNLDITNHEQAIRVGGAGFTLAGARIEVNKVGICLGQRDDGSLNAATAVNISALTMEANDIGIWIKAASHFVFSGCSITGSVNSPNLQSQYGIRNDTGNRGVFIGVGVVGTHSVTAIKSCGGVTFIQSDGRTNTAGGTWDLSDPATTTMIGCDFDLLNNGVSTPNRTGDLLTRALAAPDRVSGGKQGFNLRGINVPVLSGATTRAIVFPNQQDGTAALNTATVVSDGASTLAAAMYYYVGSLVNEVGETKVNNEKTAVVTAGNRVDIAFFGISPTYTWRRRVYRGTAPGVYDGYFELPVQSSTTFSDTGQAFTGRQTPKLIDGGIGTEPDAYYSVIVTPAWNAGACWITAKATTGFTINFGAAPGSDSSVDWMMVR